MPKFTPIYDIGCPVTLTLAMLSKRWVFFILRAIRHDIHTFSGIKKALSNTIGNRTLTSRLHELVDAGLLAHISTSDKNHSVGYYFSKKGDSIQRVIDATCDWAARFEGLPHA